MFGPEIIGALMAGFSAAVITSFQAARRSSRIEAQVKPNGNGSSTIRQMITDLLHHQTMIYDQLRDLDRRLTEHIDDTES